MLSISIATCILGLLLAGKAKPGAPLLAGSLLLAAISVLGAFLYFSVNILTENGLDESFFYHLEESLEGANLTAYDNLLWNAITGYFFSISTLIVLTIWITHKQRHHSKPLFVSGLGLLTLSIICSPTTTSIYRHYLGSSGDTVIPGYYIPPTHTTNATRNLLYIYLESVEHAYFDEKRFPGLTPNLQRLMQQGLVFDNIGQTFGAEWTIAGMVASQCGMPLTKPGKLVTAHGFSNFLPKATCIGDTLKADGYTLHYLAGANTAFASKGTFYKAHGFEKVDGLAELEATLPEKEYKTDWGLLDDTTLNLVQQRFDSLSKQEKPFAIVSLTLDTHSPFELSRSCQNKAYGNGKEGMLNAVHCTDFLLGKLIHQLKKHPDYNKTLIVIGSDHIGINVSDLIKQEKIQRKNFLLVLNSGLPPKHINKPGSTLDIAATLLPLLGARSQPYGLGRDLLGSEKTLVQAIPNVGASLAGSRRYFHQFWSFPNAKQGAQIKNNGQTLYLGKDRLQAPVLISLDKDLELLSQFHLLDGRHSMLRYFSDVDFGSRFLWLDTCSAMRQKEYRTPQKSEHCVGYGRLGGHVHVAGVDTPITITREELDQTFSQWLQPWHYFSEKRININLRDLGMAHPYRYPIANIDSKLAILSSTNSQTPALVRHDDFGYLIEIPKGLRVVGIHKDRLPDSLYSLDCTPISTRTTLKDLLKSSLQYEAVAVIYRPNDACTSTDYQHFFENSGLNEWQPAIKDNHPYIAIHTRHGQNKEFRNVGNSAALRF